MAKRKGTQMSDSERVEQLFREQQYMVLAVMLADGTPWATPVRIIKREGNQFEWDSMPQTEHSKAIVHSTHTAITVFQKKDDSQIGYYAKGTAKVIESREKGPSRYRFTASESWINDETFVKRSISL